MASLQMPAFQRQGLFWLPENTDHEVAGTLSWDPEEGLRLELLGFLDKNRDDSPWTASWGSETSDDAYPIVHGVLKKGFRNGIFSGEARWLSIFNCESVGSLVPSSGIAGETLHPTFVALGNDIPSELFTGVYLRSERLRDWRSISGFQHQRKMEKARLTERTLTWTPPENEDVTAEATTWTLGTGWRESDQQSEAPVFAEIPYITAVCDHQLSIRELLRDLVAPIDSLLTFAFDAPVLHEVWGIQEAERRTEADPGKQYVRILFERVGKGVTRTKPQTIPLVSPHKFPGGWKALIPEWLRVREALGDLSGLYFGAEFAPAPFVETRFLMIVQAVEGYHRRSKEFSSDLFPRLEHRKRKQAILESAPREHREWLKTALHRSNQPSLRGRLLDLAQTTQLTLKEIIPSPEAFASRCAELRNHYAHMIEIQDRPDGLELLRLGMKLRWVFKVRILMDLGLSTTTIQEAVEANDNYRWLCPKNSQR